MVGATNYDVADQLADVGMGGHPPQGRQTDGAGRHSDPPEEHVRARPPRHLITKDFVGERARVEIVTGTDKVTLIEIHDPSMVGTVGFDAGLMEVFCKHGVSYILKATNANSIAHLVWDSQTTQELVAELEETYQVVTIKAQRHRVRHRLNISIPGVLAKAAQALADAPMST